MKKKKLLITAIAILGLAVNTFGQTVPSYVPATGLVGWWPFNGNANDESGNGNNGTVYGAALASDRFGNANNAFSFDGIDDYIDCYTNSLLGATNSQPLTISVWVYAEPTAGGAILSKYYNYDAANSNYFLIYSPANTSVSIAGDGTNSIINSNVNSTGWIHIVAQYSSGSNNAKIFINGVLTTQSTLNINGAVANTSFVIGRLNGPLPGYYSGQIDDIGIWNRALTDQEITALFNSSTAGINEVSENNLFSVYPNPAHSQINLNADSKLLGYVYNVYDNIGQVVLSGKIISENTVIELNNLSDGIYTLSVGENKKQSFKVIKE
jgi:hypothetical protein